MLSISNLTYKIGGRTILEDCSANITDGWKVGIVGANGAGKTTLFNLITGDTQSDSGTVYKSPAQRLGFVRQDIPETDTCVLDLVLAADEETALLWEKTETEPDPNKLAEIYQKLLDKDAYAAPGKASRLLTGLGFKDEELHQPFSSFSGGWRMRVALAAALFVEPEILLLDEPTNHLDLEAIIWLESYLESYPHTLLMISHDRDLLNKCTDHIIHVENRKLNTYTGNYDTFERERAAALGLQQKMFENQQAQRAHMQKFVDRFRAQANKARQAQSRIKALERMDLVDAVIAERAVRFTFPDPDKIASPLLSLDNADVGYKSGEPILRSLNENIDKNDRIALLGANGNGKSTLMKLIAGKLDVMKGDVFRSPKLRIGYFSQHQTEELNVNSTPYEEMCAIMRKKVTDLKEPVVRAKLGAFGFSKELADNKIETLSGGEKARLLFAFMSFDAPHLLLLDEPTNHLDIDAREALVGALNAYEGAIIIVSHDPNMVERVADRLWLVDNGACKHFDGDLKDYRKFTIQSRREARKEEKELNNTTKTAKKQKKQNPAPKSNPVALKNKIHNAEKKLEQLEQEKKKLEAEMSAPEFYKGQGDKIAETQNRYNDLLEELADCETQWLNAQS